MSSNDQTYLDITHIYIHIHTHTWIHMTSPDSLPFSPRASPASRSARGGLWAPSAAAPAWTRRPCGRRRPASGPHRRRWGSRPGRPHVPRGLFNRPKTQGKPMGRWEKHRKTIGKWRLMIIEGMLSLFHYMLIVTFPCFLNKSWVNHGFPPYFGIPSGKGLHSYGTMHHAINVKIHYFDCAILTIALRNYHRVNGLVDGTIFTGNPGVGIMVLG